MVPFDKQVVTVIRQQQVGTDLTYEPPLRVGFGISDKTVDKANALMGCTILVPGAQPNATHYHANNDVCWYILSGKIRLIAAKSDCSDRSETLLEAGDFVYIPSAVRVRDRYAEIPGCARGRCGPNLAGRLSRSYPNGEHAASVDSAPDHGRLGVVAQERAVGAGLPHPGLGKNRGGGGQRPAPG